MVEGDRAIGEGARLVAADDVDASQTLDCGQLLHQHLAPRQGDSGDREGDAGQQHQPLRHHAHQPCDGAGEGLAPVDAGVELTEEQQRGGRRNGPGHIAQEAVDALHQLGADAGELAGFGGQLARVGVFAHRRGPVGSRARHNEAAREHPRAGLLFDRLGLAGQQRLVELEPARLDNSAVGHDLVAGAQDDQVVQDHGLERHLLRGPVADDGGSWSVEDGQAVQGALGAHLLDDANQRVGDQHDAEEGVLRMPHRQDHDQQGAEEEVEAGQEVGPQDLAEAAAGVLAAGIGAALGHALGDFRAAQASQGLHQRVPGGVPGVGPGNGHGYSPPEAAAHSCQSVPWQTERSTIARLDQRPWRLITRGGAPPEAGLARDAPMDSGIVGMGSQPCSMHHTTKASQSTRDAFLVCFA